MAADDLGLAPPDDTIEAYSLRTLRKRGHLKVFLGYAPGVGKTYAMLAEAQRRCSRGEDVVAGFVETHGRRETAELVEGLEQVPLKHIEYRGKEFVELDTAALIARRPQLALVDELAHTNVPGTTHAKRWQSVEEILAADISVLTTINIQHLESLNDNVYQITAVRVQETLPDFVLDRADEIVLIDLTTDALLNRLRRGVVYDLDTVPGALANFFRRGNLVALRELALRKTAEEVDDSLERYIADHETAHPWATEERIVVCVRPNEVAPKLVRRGHRLARRFKGSFWVVHVRRRPAVTRSQEAGPPPLRAHSRARRPFRGARWRLGGGRDHALRAPEASDLRRHGTEPAVTRQRGDPRFGDHARHPRPRSRGRARGRGPQQGDHREPPRRLNGLGLNGFLTPEARAFTPPSQRRF